MLVRRVAGFVVAFGLTLLLVLDGGGYDAALRHEIAIVVWLAIALGLAFGVLPRSRLRTPAVVAIGGFAALALLAALAHSWTESDERTTAELARILQYLGIVTLAYLSLNRHTWQGAAAGLAAAALFVPGLAVASRLLPDTFNDEVAQAFISDRLSYPLDYWNAVACWGAMAIAVGLVWSAHAERRLVRSITLAAVPLAALSVYLTYSRAGVVATALAVGAAIAFSVNRWTAVLNALVAGGAGAAVILVARGQDEIARATGGEGAGTVVLVLLLAGVACGAAAFATSRLGADRLRLSPRHARTALVAGVLCVIAAAAVLNGPIRDGWEEFKNERTVTAGTDPTARLSTLGGTRYPVWTAAVDAFKTDATRGIGPGSFEFYWSREGDNPEFARDAHSLYLEHLAELGVPGLLALLAGLGGLLVTGVRARARWTRARDFAAGGALLATFVVFLFYAAVDWVWELGAIGTLALGGAAVAGAASFHRAPSAGLRLPVRIAAPVVALLCAAVQVPGLISLERVRGSDELLTAGQLDRAAELAVEAEDAEPWAASPYAMEALVAEADGDLDAARAFLGDAIEREPTNWRHHLLLARVEAREGDREGVDAELAEVRRLAPNSVFLIKVSPFRLGLEELLSSKSPEAGP